MNAVKWSKRIISLPLGEHLKESDIKDLFFNKILLMLNLSEYLRCIQK